jgi:hypothetical protein
MKKSILFLLVLIFISLAANKEINAQSIIDCNGNLSNCTLDANGWQDDMMSFIYDGCKFDIHFNYAKCVTGKSIIDITEISVSNENNLPCPYPDASYMVEIIQFMLLKSPDIFNFTDYGPLNEVYVKTFSCALMVQYQNPVHTRFEPCNTNCCVTKYEIAKRFDGVRLVTQSAEIDGAQIYGCGACPDMCWSHLMPTVPLDIYNSDFEQNDYCNLECYWRLDGNNFVTNTSFLGSINNQPIRIKSNNQEIMKLQNGKVGIKLPINTEPFSALDVRGTISTGYLDAISGLYKDGTLSLYPGVEGGSIFHIDNRNPGSFHISSGPEPGWVLPSSDPTNQPLRGANDLISIHNWGKTVGIGCLPFDSRTYTKTLGSLNISGAKMGCAGPQGMLTVSDELYPYWDGITWQSYSGNGTILRVERRNNGIDDANKNYTLISAGHNSSETFKVLANGLVKIGDLNYSGSLPTILPKLSVDGSIVAKEMIITVSDWSDFVFKPDYKLMDLNSLESFIILNKHLPGLPNATSVAKDGIEVGNMQKILLQKIEELTLYVIELKKDNEEIKKKLENKQE